MKLCILHFDLIPFAIISTLIKYLILADKKLFQVVFGVEGFEAKVLPFKKFCRDHKK